MVRRLVIGAAVVLVAACGSQQTTAVVVGKGMRLFDEGESIPLKRLSSQTFETGVVYLVYGPAEPPAAAGYDEAKAHLPQDV